MTSPRAAMVHHQGKQIGYVMQPTGIRGVAAYTVAHEQIGSFPCLATAMAALRDHHRRQQAAAESDRRGSRGDGRR